jgi:hypothetical protein
MPGEGLLRLLIEEEQPPWAATSGRTRALIQGNYR